ncbi:MAG: RluA family pseudouridine synthase, partial [Planctomycetes bacterium]|nr:RluA family pseudouridine synthase [Planctomycetota bacterium]
PVARDRRVGDLADLSLHGGSGGSREIFAPGGECGIEILFEDDRLTVLSKPAGIPVVPDRRGGLESCLGSLIRRELEARRTKPLESYVRPRIVHRIDRFTSGVVLVARTPAAERALGDLFERRRVVKEYVAIVSGTVAAARITVICPVCEGRKGRMRAGQQGPEAETRFDVLERYGSFTLVRAQPRSGRMHQIRVHAAAVGHPLAIDPVYAPRGRLAAPRPPGIERLTLHAWRYSLPPEWGELGSRVFTAPLPADLRRSIDLLRQSASR